MARVGLISDTHGLLRPQVFRPFKGVDLILHAGDIGSLQVLDELRTIAPVRVIRGNNDRDTWARDIPEREIVKVQSVSIYMIHDLKELATVADSTKYQVVISGHSHRPSIEKRDGVLFVNPGSAGPRRFKLPVTVGRMTITGRIVEAEILKLPI